MAYNRKTDKQYLVHVYIVNGRHESAYFDTKQFAINYAKKRFDRDSSTYKCKVWDLEQGEPQPNLVNAPGLIFEIV